LDEDRTAVPQNQLDVDTAIARFPNMMNFCFGIQVTETISEQPLKSVRMDMRHVIWMPREP